MNIGTIIVSVLGYGVSLLFTAAGLLALVGLIIGKIKGDDLGDVALGALVSVGVGFCFAAATAKLTGAI